MAYSAERIITKRKNANFRHPGQREGCHNCCFVELKSVIENRGKNFYCMMMSIPTPAYGICDKHVKREKP